LALQNKALSVTIRYVASDADSVLILHSNREPLFCSHIRTRHTNKDASAHVLGAQLEVLP